MDARMPWMFFLAQYPRIDPAHSAPCVYELALCWWSLCLGHRVTQMKTLAPLSHLQQGLNQYIMTCRSYRNIMCSQGWHINSLYSDNIPLIHTGSSEVMPTQNPPLYLSYQPPVTIFHWKPGTANFVTTMTDQLNVANILGLCNHWAWKSCRELMLLEWPLKISNWCSSSWLLTQLLYYQFWPTTGY